MLRVEMLPAKNGDCLWIEYGSSKAPKRILIDGGTGGSADALIKKINALKVKKLRLELLVITHVDGDHIAGVIKMLKKSGVKLDVGDVWFNGWEQLAKASGFQSLGPKQGEDLSSALLEAKLPWNKKFTGGPVMATDNGALDTIPLAGDMKLVVLGPTRQKLKDLLPVWKKACIKAGIKKGELVPIDESELKEFGEPEGRPLAMGAAPDVEKLALEEFSDDDAPANGSSIVLLLRYQGKDVLLAGDAHPVVIQQGLERVAVNGGRVALDAYKVSHHGSHHNITESLLSRMSCSRYLFSSNGDRFEHPSQEAVAKVLMYGGKGKKQLVFNYKTDFNRMWDLVALKDKHTYETFFPANEAEGIVAFEA